MEICATCLPDFTLTVKMHDLYSHLSFGKGVATVANAIPSVSLVANAISFAAADESGPPQAVWHPVDATSNVQSGPSSSFGKRVSGTLFAISTDPPPMRASKTTAEAKRKTRDIPFAVAFISTASANKKPEINTSTSPTVTTPVPPLFNANGVAQKKPDRIAQPVQRISNVCPCNRNIQWTR